MFGDQLHYYINDLSYKVIFNIPYLISVLKQWIILKIHIHDFDLYI